MKKRTGFISTVVIGLAAIFFAAYTQNSEEKMASSPAESVPTLGTSQPLESTAIVESTRPENLEQEVAEVTPLSSFKGAEELPQTEQASLWKAFGEARRAIRPLTDHQKTMPENEGALYLASSPSQKIRARFLDDGVRLLSGYPNREWNGVMSLDTEGDVLEVRQDGTQIEYVRDGIVEWFHNKPEGLEHGYIVERKTTLLRQGYGRQTEGQLIVPVQIQGLEVREIDGELVFVNDAGEAVLSYTKLKVWDANGIELTASMKPTSDGLELLIADANAVYPVMVDPLIASFETRLWPTVDGDQGEEEGFGHSVSISGDTAVIGAYNSERYQYSNGVYVFVRNGAEWLLQERIYPDDIGYNHEFGFSVDIYEDTLAIGATGDDRGSVYIYERSGAEWNFRQKLKAEGSVNGGEFGCAVSVHGIHVLVGAWGHQGAVTGSGAAYVFVSNGINWLQEAKLSASDGASGDRFGWSVSLYGDTALVGSFLDDDVGNASGSTYVFAESGGGVWAEQQKLTASDAAAEDRFGAAVSLFTDTAFVGATSDDDKGSGSGSVYVYERTGSIWTEVQKLTASDGAATDYFGFSIAVEGATAVIGAVGDSDMGDYSGSAYVFKHAGGSWMEEQKISAGDGNTNDEFGRAVALSGQTVVVGAAKIDNELQYDTGGTYIFSLTNKVWMLEQKITAGDSGYYDSFGNDVGLDGDIAVVGEAQDDDNGINSGSVYVFSRTGTVWNLEQKIVAYDGATSDFFGGAVAVSGNTILIGASGDDDLGASSGSVYAYIRTASEWQLEQKLTAVNGQNNRRFGSALSLQDNRAVIGARAYSSVGGSAYVIERTGQVWTHQQTISARDNQLGNYFGSSVDLDGNSIVIGAYEKNVDGVSAAGGAYVYSYNGSNWSEQQQLSAHDGAYYDRYGAEVSISGDTVLVGSKGGQYVYVYADDVWHLQQKLSDAGGAFSAGVCVAGNLAIVGAKAYVREGTNWTHTLTLSDPDNNPMGRAVSISGDTVLIGANDADGLDKFGDDVEYQGAAFIFRISNPVGEIEISGPSGSIMDGTVVSFGSQAVGISKHLALIIQNDSTNNLSGIAISKSGSHVADIDYGSIRTNILLGSESTSLRITYTPMSIGSHTATVHIVSNDSDESPFDITFTGTGLANGDSDPGSDMWETANGFSPSVDGDVMTLDSDGDGYPDIMEIFQGTERYPAIPESAFAVMALGEEGNGNGFSDISTSNGVLKVRYRRSTTQTAVMAQPLWVSDLTDNSWLYSGESASGTVVTVSENVVSNGVDFEIVESSAEVTGGNTDALFFTLELSPNE